MDDIDARVSHPTSREADMPNPIVHFEVLGRTKQPSKTSIAPPSTGS
jgi:hypothetical protein